jgi:transcription elongation GreA/GreB family factor
VFSIVGEWEADPMAKKISHSSPLGRSLMGKKLGDQVEVEAPVGRIVYTITQIG